MLGILNQIQKSVMQGDLEGTQKNVQIALNSEISSADILQKGLIPAMDEVGKLFEEGEYFVPEMLIAARAMKGGLEIIKPLLIDSDVKPIGKVAIGTVKGDLHDIGKNLVSMMLEGAGFEIMDLGTDVSPESVLKAVRDGVDIVGLSALLTTTMPNMEETIKELITNGLRQNVKVIIGGAPVTTDYAQKIGADGFAPDASQAVKLAKSLVL